MTGLWERWVGTEEGHSLSKGPKAPLNVPHTEGVATATQQVEITQRG